MRTLPRTLVIAAALLLGGAVPVRTQPSEYSAKIVLMDKMTRFVDWPKPADPEQPFVLAVLGRTPFGEVLDDYFSSHPLKDRPVTIRYLRQVQELQEADLLFICASEKARLAQILAKVKGRPILTVADSEGFARAGVMVGFVSSGGKIAFEVNPIPIRDSGIRMRPDFLQIAKIVP
jgi:hypothetical protein